MHDNASCCWSLVHIDFLQNCIRVLLGISLDILNHVQHADVIKPNHDVCRHTKSKGLPLQKHMRLLASYSCHRGEKINALWMEVLQLVLADYSIHRDGKSNGIAAVE